MKRKVLLSLTALIALIIAILIGGLFFKKDTKNNDLTTIKVSDATLTSWTY